MSVINLTRQTSLRGRDLQNAVTAAIQEVASRSPYSLLNMRSSWTSGTLMAVSAGRHMSGQVQIQDGDPSTVTITLNLLSSTAQAARNSAIRDITAAADRHVPAVGAPTPTTTAPAPTPTTPGEPAPTPTTTTRPRRDFDWGLFTDIFSGIVGGAASGLNAYNEAVGLSSGQNAINIASDEAVASGGKPSASATGVQYGPGFELGPGKPVGPDEPPPGPTVAPTTTAGAPPPTLAAPRTGFPTWGWWAIGIGGLGLLGVIILATRKSDDEDEFEEY